MPAGSWSKLLGTTSSPTAPPARPCGPGGSWHPQPLGPVDTPATSGCTSGGCTSATTRRNPWSPTSRSPANSPAGAGPWQSWTTNTPGTPKAAGPERRGGGRAWSDLRFNYEQQRDSHPDAMLDTARPAEALQPNSPSCGTQPANISLTAPSRTDTHANSSTLVRPQERRPESHPGAASSCPLTRPTYISVDVELIPFGIGHGDSVMIQTLRDDREQPRGTERNEPRRLSIDPLAPGVERRTATTARVHVDVDAVLERLLLGDDLEPDARTLTVRILDDVRATTKFVFRHTNRPEEVVPRVEAGRVMCSRSPVGTTRPPEPPRMLDSDQSGTPDRHAREPAYRLIASGRFPSSRTRLLETSRRAGVWPDSVQVSGGGLSTRLPTKCRCGSLPVCSPSGTVDEAWLERGLPSS